MNRRQITTALIGFLFFSAACSLPFSVISNQAFIATAADATIQAYLTESAPEELPPTATIDIPELTEGPQVPEATVTTAYAAPAAAPARACNSAAFVSETVADGTAFKPGTGFTKSWRLKNVGTCTWNPNYRFVFTSGEQMGGPNSVALTKYIAPGEQVDFSVNLTAPAKAGTYRGNWSLRSDGGNLFGQVYTIIKVSSSASAATPTPKGTAVPTSTPRPFFAVTRVRISSTQTPAVDCDGLTTVSVQAQITASTAGNVYYRWVLKKGTKVLSTSEERLVIFNEGGVLVVPNVWQLEAGIYDVEVYIARPNNQTFGPHQFTVAPCVVPDPPDDPGEGGG